jgi:hypothetical protein
VNATRWIGYFRVPQTRLMCPIFNTNGDGLSYPEPSQARTEAALQYEESGFGPRWNAEVEVREVIA